MMPRSMRDADGAGDEEGERQGDDQRPVEQAGRGVADDLLHDEGRVGAEHHHLAMRHVDDAHHAEGDGEADGREQQHRAERDAVPDVLRRRPRRRALAIDAAPGVAGAASSSPLGAGLRSGQQRRERIAVAARRDGGDGGAASRRSARSECEHDGGARLLMARLDRRRPSRPPARRSMAAKRRGSGDLNTRLGGSQARGRIGLQQASASRAPRDRARAGGC